MVKSLFILILGLTLPIHAAVTFGTGLVRNSFSIAPLPLVLQDHIYGTNLFNIFFGDSHWLATKFTATNSYYATAAEVNFSRLASYNTLIYALILTNNNGTPGDIVGTASAGVSATDIIEYPAATIAHRFTNLSATIYSNGNYFFTLTTSNSSAYYVNWPITSQYADPDPKWTKYSTNGTDWYEQVMYTRGAFSLFSKMGAAVPTNSAPQDTNLLFAWHCESTNVLEGTPVGYSAGDTSAVPRGTNEISSLQYQDGTHSLRFDNSYQYYTFGVTNQNIVSSVAGTVDFWFYWTTGGAGYGFYYGNDGNNRIFLGIDNGGYLYMYHVSGGTTVFARTGYPILADSTWHHCKARWDTNPHAGVYLQVTCDTTTGEGNVGVLGESALGTWAGAVDNSFSIGDGASGLIYVDNFKIYNNWQP